MKTATQVRLAANLKELCLTGIRANLERELRQAKEERIDYEAFLLALTDVELEIRRANRFKRRISEAKFPLLKTLEMFDFSAAPDLDGQLVRELMNGEYLTRPQNVLLIGRSGTGKTHLATALGVEACRKGVRTRFVTACGLANEMLEARSEKTLKAVLSRYERYGLLILDELGYVPLSREGAELLFQVLAQRHERKPVIITTNLSFGDWTQVFGDANLTAALLDRVTHRAHLIECRWESYRFKESLRLKRQVVSESAAEEKKD